jgi:hypothetical protein
MAKLRHGETFSVTLSQRIRRQVIVKIQETVCEDTNWFGTNFTAMTFRTILGQMNVSQMLNEDPTHLSYF